jgi:hypothetical protein
MYIPLPNSISITNDLIPVADIVADVTKIDNYINSNNIPLRILSKSHPEKIFKNIEYFQFVDLGELDKKDFDFNDNPIIDINFCHPTNIPPYITLTTNQYGGYIYASIASFIDTVDEEIIKYLLE